MCNITADIVAHTISKSSLLVDVVGLYEAELTL